MDVPRDFDLLQKKKKGDHKSVLRYELHNVPKETPPYFKLEGNDLVVRARTKEGLHEKVITVSGVTEEDITAKVDGKEIVVTINTPGRKHEINVLG